jgi:Immunity protein 21
MQWISTAGGPLICGEPSTVVDWLGVIGLSSSRAGQCETDYELACSVSDYLGLIPCGTGHALVLGDEPMQAAFFITHRGEHAIARWISAPSKYKAELLLNSQQLYSELMKQVNFVVKNDCLIMFDAGSPAKSALASSPKITIKSGEYKITTEKIEHKEDKCKFIIHRFT